MATEKNAASFRADAASTAEEQEWLATGVHTASDDHYLLFERALPIGSDEDWGVYIEFDDQANSGYDAIAGCWVDRQALRVELTKPIDSEGEYREIRVSLELDETQWHSLVKDLRRVFEGHERLLQIV